MPRRGPQEQAHSRIASCKLRLHGLELELLEQSERFGPVFKELLAALEYKLGTVCLRAAALDEVGPIRSELLWRELRPVLEALEDGLRDLDRLLCSLRELGPCRKPEELESVYDELGRRERWFLQRLRHSAGESVAEGSYRCCGCGAYSRPGPGLVLSPCYRCSGTCHHHVSSD